VSIKREYKVFDPSSYRNYNGKKKFFMQICVSIDNVERTIFRSIPEFIRLEHSLIAEFSISKYSKTIIINLPKLLIKDKIILNDYDYSNDQNIVACEHFIRKVIKRKYYVIDEALKFFNIYDEDLSHSYGILRKNEMIKFRNLRFREQDKQKEIKLRSNYKVDCADS